MSHRAAPAGAQRPLPGRTATSTTAPQAARRSGVPACGPAPAPPRGGPRASDPAPAPAPEAEPEPTGHTPTLSRSPAPTQGAGRIPGRLWSSRAWAGLALPPENRSCTKEDEKVRPRALLVASDYERGTKNNGILNQCGKPHFPEETVLATLPTITEAVIILCQRLGWQICLQKNPETSDDSNVFVLVSYWVINYENKSLMLPPKMTNLRYGLGNKGQGEKIRKIV